MKSPLAHLTDKGQSPLSPVLIPAIKWVGFLNFGGMYDRRSE